MSDELSKPWWRPVDSSVAASRLCDIDHPNIPLIQAHGPWEKDDALALGEEALWVIVEPGDFDTAMAVQAVPNV